MKCGGESLIAEEIVTDVNIETTGRDARPSTKLERDSVEEAFPGIATVNLSADPKSVPETALLASGGPEDSKNEELTG